MNSIEDKVFCEQFEKVKIVFSYVWLITVPTRVAFGIFYSFDKAFGNNQWKVSLSFSIFLLGLIAAGRYSISTKRLYFLLFVQYCCVTIKYMSLKVEPEAEMLYCILNTIIILLFETLIYQNSAWVAVSMIKLVVIWVSLDFKNPEYLLSFKPINIPILMSTTAIIFMTCFYENLKMKLYKSEFESKKICKAAHDQLFDILKVFPDGLMVISSECNLKFNNNTITEMLNKAENIIDYLNTIKSSNNNLSILQQVKEFFFKINAETSLGIISIDSKIFECRAHKIKWDNEDSCMLTLKNVTSILTLERINAENDAKSSIIRSVSHEFRTPINCIDLVIDELFPKLTKVFQEKLEILKINTRLLIYQLNDILDYSDITSGKLKLFESEINIKDDLIACTELIKCQAEYKNVNVILNIDQSVPDKIFVDGYRVKKVVINLLTNALKYTSKGTIKLLASCQENYLRIALEDTGIGIPLERQGMLFEMLSNNSSSSLCGLGLHVCKKILENMNSALNFKSAFGEGTTFSFDLNLDQITPKYLKSESLSDTDLDSIPDEIDLQGESISSSKKKHFNSINEEFGKVMIVDDNEFNRMCLASILKNEGIQYIEASDGDGDVAVNKVLTLNKTCEPVKCIIMDLNMPVMDGWEATRLIKQLYSQGKIKTLPVIIGHTAYCSQEDLHKCYEAGMISYLIKPTPQSQIVSIIKNYI